MIAYAQALSVDRKALEIAQKFTDENLSEIKYYHFTVGKFDGVDAILSYHPFYMLPLCNTVPMARSGPVWCEAARTMFTPSSAVV